MSTDKIEWVCETCEGYDPSETEKYWGLCHHANLEDSYLKTLDGKPPKVNAKFYCQEHTLKMAIANKYCCSGCGRDD